MGADALKELIAGETAQQPVKQDESVGGVGGAVSDQSVEKKEDYDKELEEMLHLKKRKPRKKKQVDMTSIGQALEEISAAVSEAPSSSAVTAEKKIEDVTPEKDSFDDFELPKKKKKRRPNITFEGYDILAVVEEIGGEEGDADTATAMATEDGEGGWKTVEAPWEDSDRDYTYEELLERVFNIIKQNNPNYASGQKKKLVMKPPQVVRVGAKKTSFVNFTEICRLLHRQPKHLMNFLLVELGTSASLDGTQQLIIKGKFQQKQIETVLRRYIKEYVTCHTCRSPETNLHKETRLFFLQCETCGSRCSVQNIKSGFQAVTSKRAQIRSKAQ